MSVLDELVNFLSEIIDITLSQSTTYVRESRKELRSLEGISSFQGSDGGDQVSTVRKCDCQRYIALPQIFETFLSLKLGSCNYTLLPFDEVGIH